MKRPLDEAVAWLLADSNRGYRQASKRFAVDYDAVKEAGRLARARAHAKPEAVEVVEVEVVDEDEHPVAEPGSTDGEVIDLAAMPTLERLEWQLRKATEHLADLEVNPKGTTALNGMHTQIRELGFALDAERARLAESNPDPEEAMSDAELVEFIAASVQNMTPDQFDQVVEVVERRLAGPRLIGGTDA